MKPIMDYPNYLISESGKVINSKNSKTLKQGVNSNGYAIVSLKNTIGFKTFLVHRLIMQTFVENPENKPCVNHKDGNKRNNKISNLEWVTHAENTQHAFKTGLIKRGQESIRYNPKEFKAIDFAAIKKQLPLNWSKALSKKTGISSCTLRKYFNSKISTPEILQACIDLIEEVKNEKQRMCDLGITLLAEFDKIVSGEEEGEEYL